MSIGKKLGTVDSAVVPRFSDIATFLRTPRHEIDPVVDIGFVGVPFDLGVNYRTGARSGPAGVREASRLIRKVHQTSNIKPYDLCNIADLGDAPINPMSKDISIDNIEQFFRELKAANIVPIAVGGDHTIPLPILRALVDKDEPVGILHIDAHADVLDTICDDKINHATFMRRAMEEGILDPKRVIQIGLRGSRFSEDDVKFSYDVGYEVITMDDYDEMGRAAVIEKINETLGDGKIYVSIDIDGLDPAYLPGTGVPEIGGIIPRDMQVILRSLQGKDVIGADFAEIAPMYDPTGMTCVTVANLMFEIMCIIADNIDRKRD